MNGILKEIFSRHMKTTSHSSVITTASTSSAIAAVATSVFNITILDYYFRCLLDYKPLTFLNNLLSAFSATKLYLYSNL